MESRRNGPQLSSRHDDDDDDGSAQRTNCLTMNESADLTRTGSNTPGLDIENLDPRPDPAKIVDPVTR